jgi:hypothetical protein
MKKTIKIITIIVALICNSSFLFAQLASSNDNTEYGIAKKISDKATAKNLGAIHSESSKMRPTAGKGGYFLRYEKGWVYYNPKKQNAYFVGGEIMNKWASQNYETGWLGFPTLDASFIPKRNGVYCHFDNGSIYCSPNTGCHFMGGAFKEYWLNVGAENSAQLGFPKTDEIVISINGYTRYQQFEKGTLFFGNNKPVLYSNNPSAITPPLDNSTAFELFFKPREMYGFESGPTIDEYTDLYGWMDLRVYTGDGREVQEVDGKSFSLFSIDKSRYLENETDGKAGVLNFTENNINFQRRYNFTQAQIDANAYVRITYWLNDNDKLSANDYLKLQASNGSWHYNGGNHGYREIKLKDILRANGKNIENVDVLSDGKGDELRIRTLFTLNNK